MDRCEYCGGSYQLGVGCQNKECPQRYAFHIRCSCGAPMHERGNGNDPDKRTYYCKDCKLYVFMNIEGGLESFYCNADGCVHKGKAADPSYIEPLKTHNFDCPSCSTSFRIRMMDLGQWYNLMHRV